MSYSSGDSTPNTSPRAERKSRYSSDVSASSSFEEDYLSPPQGSDEYCKVPLQFSFKTDSTLWTRYSGSASPLQSSSDKLDSSEPSQNFDPENSELSKEDSHRSISTKQTP